MSNQNDVLGPNGATPVFNGGSFFRNVTTSINVQVKTGAGVFEALGINTGGTGSAVAMYDGTSNVVTISTASPGVVTWPAGKKPAAGTAVKFTSTGTLPTGITSNTTYYVSTAGATATAAQIADSQSHALAGTNSVNTSGSPSGVHTAWDVSDPIGSYSTTAQGNVPVAAAVSDGLIAIATDGGAAANVTVLYV